MIKLEVVKRATVCFVLREYIATTAQLFSTVSSRAARNV